MVIQEVASPPTLKGACPPQKLNLRQSKYGDVQNFLFYVDFGGACRGECGSVAE